jgi:hypothetical protein
MQEGASNNQTKPSLASQHQVVMLVCQSVPLYDMQSHTSSSLLDILQASRNTDKVMMVSTVTTNRLSQVKQNPKYLEMWISFCPSVTQDDED